jgi:cytochrome P450 family 9
MRQMFDFVSTVGFQTATTMKKDILNGLDNNFEFKELAQKFTVDNIASCGFGIEVNSFKNPDNDFLRIARKVTDFTSFKVAIKFFAYMAFPKVMKALKIRIMDKESCDFFQTALFDTMKTRERENIVRHDMINLLLQAKNGQLKHSTNNNNNNNDEEEKTLDGFATVEESQLGKAEVKRKWDDEDLAAQCFIFFLAGFDTVAQTMSFVAYELACNPDIQQKLYEELAEMNEETSGKKINYDQLQRLKYLDQVLSETMRKWPAAPAIDRICVKDYELKEDNKVTRFEKGLLILIPIWSLHRDPQYYPNPEKFDPDRFSDENKRNIDPDTYMPFGVGPR